MEKWTANIWRSPASFISPLWTTKLTKVRKTNACPVRKPTSCSTEGCVQLVLHEGKEETSLYPPNHQLGQNLTDNFHSASWQRYLWGLLWAFCHSKKSQIKLNGQVRLLSPEHRYLRERLPHALSWSFIPHKQLWARNTRVHVAEQIRGFPWFLLPEVCPQGISSGIVRLRSKCAYTSTSEAFLAFTLKNTF